MLKHEQALLGIKPQKEKEEKRNLQPLVIEIDEDELINADSFAKRLKEPKLPPVVNKKKRGHLRIESDDLAPVDAVEIKSIKNISEEDKNHWTRKEKAEEEQDKEKEKENKKRENVMFWDYNL